MRVESFRVVVRAAIALALLLGLLVEVRAARADEPGTTTLHGVVTAEQGGAPQAGASVSIAALGALVFTDAQGAYSLSVPPGNHVVRVEGPGLVAREQAIEVGA